MGGYLLVSDTEVRCRDQMAVVLAQALTIKSMAVVLNHLISPSRSGVAVVLVQVLKIHAQIWRV